MALSDEQILSILNAEISQSTYFTGADSDHEIAESYYRGDPNGLEKEGKSKVTSTDVADAVDWILPQVMKAFTESGDILVFDPVHADDEEQAEIETDYVYDLAFKQNDGYVAIHSLVKDALLHRNGLLKIFFSPEINKVTKRYEDISLQELEFLSSDPDIAILQHSDNGDGTFSVKLVSTTNNNKIVIEPVRLEDFIYNIDHESISLEDARFTSHVVQKTSSELIVEGFDKDVVDKLSTSSTYRGNTSRHDDEIYQVSEDKSLRLITIFECFLKIDLDEDGIATLHKIVAAGDGENVTSILSTDEIAYQPWVSATGILVPHEFNGISIFDKIKEVQDQKTALWRNLFDNLYLSNNQRTAVVDGQVNLDDLTTSRPGGVVRTKRLDSIMPLVNPQIGPEGMLMMEYLDKVKAGRSGVSAEGTSAPQEIGDRVGSDGIDRLMTAKEELVGLIVRTIAETGIKPLFIKLRDLSRDNVDTIIDMKFRGKWRKVSPSEWGDRTSTTVRVGLGAGDKERQISAVNKVIELQSIIQNLPGQTLVSAQQMYNSVKDFCKMNGIVNPDKYVLDPSSPEGQQKKMQSEQKSAEEKKKQDDIQQAMVSAQVGLAKAELGKSQAQQQNVKLDAQNDSLKSQIEILKQELETANDAAEMAFKYEELETNTALELAKIQADADKFTENKEKVETDD